MVKNVRGKTGIVLRVLLQFLPIYSFDVKGIEQSDSSLK